MKFFESFSPFRRTSSTKPTTAKMLSMGIAALVLSASLWIFIGAKEKPLPHSEILEPEVLSESTVRGLSRQRKDFDKALDILETAALTDERLTDYLARVQKRVRGESASPEMGSGVRIVNHERKNAQPLELKRLSATDASSTTSNQVQNKNVWAKLKSFLGRNKTTDSQPLADSKTAPVADSASGSMRLTVGDMKFEKNPAIERWINYYTVSNGGRQTMQIGINRSGSYLDLARTEFHHLGVPRDLVWLAHVESVWHVTAVSPAAAGGLWQFIPRTAMDYDLTIGSGQDERLDPAKQTLAAATYLRDLYTIFGDWALAMAAYNCGEPRVMNAIVKNGKADFWELHEKQLLPKETLNYVPKILAAITVASNAESYGFSPATQFEVPSDPSSTPVARFDEPTSEAVSQ